MSNDVHDIDIDIDSLAPRYVEVLQIIKKKEPISKGALADEIDCTIGTVYSKVSTIRNELGDSSVIKNTEEGYRLNKKYSRHIETEDDEEELGDLNQREEYILKSLPATTDEICDDLGVSDKVVKAHMQSIGAKNFDIEYDEDIDTWYSDDSQQIRSSEAIGTRTRKANEWWQKRHDELEREFRALETPDCDIEFIHGNQDFVSHITDLHMGDLVINEDDKEVYNTEICQKVVNYITDKQMELYNLQSQLTDFDVIHDLWGGDFLTNEAIYGGQWEDIDAFLDQQHDAITEPLMRRVKMMAREAKSLNIVCVTGNHGEHRASGNSKQANADLILYKHMRDKISLLQDEADMLQNVSMQIAEGRKTANFEMRGGEFRGHLRHGDSRKAGFRTASAQNEWRETLLTHDFDIGYMGHVHRGQRFDVNCNPVFVTGTPKPPDEFVEKIAGGDNDNIALAHGISDDGLTFNYRIDLRDFEA